MFSRIGLWFRAALPLVAVAVFARTLLKCLAMMHADGHFEKWHLSSTELPIISMLGLEEPEHSVSPVGFRFSLPSSS